MPTLNVTNFSCLSNANITLAPVNIIIGPQGSGKSVTTKLIYFFTDILTSCLQAAERGESIEEYKKTIAKQFCLWFPPSAWGCGRFNITYNSSQFFIRVLRRKAGGNLSETVTVNFSDWFVSFYEEARKKLASVKETSEFDGGSQFSNDIDKVWEVRDLLRRRMSDELGDDYFPSQTFIPAGRAFFTTIGKIVAALEQVGSLDPITIKFARLYANIRDRKFRFVSARARNYEQRFREKRSSFMKSIFGGQLKIENEHEFVETEDGRKISFAHLSSGQQEMLPMWSLIDYLMQQDAFFEERRTRIKTTRPSELLYIEEPEAHLFPSAQSLLMDFLIESIRSESSNRSLILTTHSPYIMGKLNVFLKAGQLGRRKKKNHDVAEIVPRECWLSESDLSAFALENGNLRNLMDDGLIDGTYLDEVSEEISRQFSLLLKIESEMQ